MPAKKISKTKKGVQVKKIDLVSDFQPRRSSLPKKKKKVKASTVLSSQCYSENSEDEEAIEKMNEFSKNLDCVLEHAVGLINEKIVRKNNLESQKKSKREMIAKIQKESRGLVAEIKEFESLMKRERKAQKEIMKQNANLNDEIQQIRQNFARC